MKLTDLIGLSFENLRRRMGRTTLTIIGVVVGTCSIVVMMSLGIAMNVGFEEMLANWGDLTKINVYNWGGGKEVPALDDAIIKEISQYEHVKVATPEYRPRYLNAQITAGKNKRYQMQAYNIVGVYPEAIEALEYELLSGHSLPLSPAPVAGGKGKLVVLAGQNAAYEFRDTKKRGDKSQRWPGMTDAQGNTLPPFFDITKEKLTFLAPKQNEEKGKDITYEMEVIGVMKEDYKKGYVTSAGILMDLNVLKRLEAEFIKANNIKISKDMPQGYDTVTVKVDDIENVKDVEDKIKALGYGTDSASGQREQMQKQAQTMQMVLGGLGAVSLFVAALSIANTMTMAIYERTREIGVMKVLGCGLGKIRTMFLLEAAMIGFLGGVFGVVLSYTLSFALNYFAPMLMQMGIGNFLPMFGSKISVIPPWLAMVGIVFSTLIGILSGIMPANRAVKISALEAIRHE
ncbi:MAG: ABC transporter permease [Oscillospiraceae bacterium]|nr:ABC transporter permease [Oscillospiraceae bacterium]